MESLIQLLHPMHEFNGRCIHQLVSKPGKKLDELDSFKCPYHRSVKEACAGNHAQDCLEEVDTFSTLLCVVVCVRIQIDSVPVHNATQEGAEGCRGFYG